MCVAKCLEDGLIDGLERLLGLPPQDPSDWGLHNLFGQAEEEDKDDVGKSELESRAQGESPRTLRWPDYLMLLQQEPVIYACRRLHAFRALIVVTYLSAVALTARRIHPSTLGLSGNSTPT